jgi:RHS repeat-associated protein
VNITVNRVAALNFIHADHLNTPRLVADSTGTTVWRWDQQEAFGSNPADENPSALGNFDLPLRYPGQYFDRETNLHYNYFRDYDSVVGRYVESDPLGNVLYKDVAKLALRRVAVVPYAQQNEDDEILYNDATARFTVRLNRSREDFAERFYRDVPTYNFSYSYAEADPLGYSDPSGLQVTYGHGARHLAGTGLSPSAVESSITQFVRPILPMTTPGAGFCGCVSIGGTSIIFRAMPLPGGVCHIGTYFPR